jgi:hypothetical protein
MRKLALALLAAMLMVAVAAPAAAAPGENNKHVDLWTIDCPSMDEFTVVAKGVPGWGIVSEKGTPPVHLRAAVFNVWEDGVIVEGPFVVEAPRGLEPKLVGPCDMHLAFGDPGIFDVVATDVYYFFPSR